MRETGSFETSRTNQPITMSLVGRLQTAVARKPQRLEILIDMSLRILECDAV